MDIEKELERNIERAAKSYKQGDEKRWASAYFAAQIVGHKPVVFGATIALAERMGKSVDAVEDLAHAYFLYSELREDPKFHRKVQRIRRKSYIYYSYFRALYEARNNYHLSLSQVMSILDDMDQAQGKLHQEDLEKHIIDRFGDGRDWTYYGDKAFREIHKTLQQPDLPKNVKMVLLPAYEVLAGDKDRT